VPPPKSAAWAEAPALLSADQKESLTLQALGLLQEQVQARVVHYKSELATNAELDAITAEVVAQLKAMQVAAAAAQGSRQSTEEMEAQHVHSLTQLLQKVFSSESQFTTRILTPLGRRVAKLFFESELHTKSAGNKDKVIGYAEQGVYYLLGRYKNRLRAELEGFAFADAEVRQASFDMLAKVERDLQIAFLSRRSPELNQVMTIYAGVVSEFMREYLPPRLDAMARNTVRSAETARRPNSVGYRVQADAFPAFREHWERVFMEQMVNFCGDELGRRMNETGSAYRDETIRFFADPHVYSDSAEVVCHELYEFLCLEGFVDLPVNFRVATSSVESND